MIEENYNEKITSMIVSKSGTIGDAVKAIVNSMLGIALVVDSNSEQFIGVLTDGDIRRALLNKYDNTTPISIFEPFNSVTAKINTDPEKINELFSARVRVIPILDQKNKVVDLAVFDKRIYLPIAEPFFDHSELKYVMDCVSSGWISSSGKYISIFEKKFAEFCETKYALSCSNGTCALHLALKSLDIGPGDEVIVPTLTFISTASMVTLTGATPVFVDSETETWCMDPTQVEKAITDRTRAIIPVHLYGHPAQMDQIMKIARRHNLIVIEDAAEAHGSKYKNTKVGSLGDIGVFSFYGNKVVTTGEGGMVVTNNKNIAKKIKILRDHGMDRRRGYWHPTLGFNYRMTNLQAAIGTAQMEKIDIILNKKKTIAKLYEHNLKDVKAFILPKEAPWATNIYWLYSVLIIESKAGIKRDELINKLKIGKIDARPIFTPLHVQPVYNTGQKLPIAEKIANQGFSLPSYVNLNEDDIFRVCELLKNNIQNCS